jgi:hypothetical protein
MALNCEDSKIDNMIRSRGDEGESLDLDNELVPDSIN